MEVGASGKPGAVQYDGNARLKSITDTIGLTSSVSYDDNSLINALTTPYGTTKFAYTAPGSSGPPRFVEVTDPLGYHEREEWLEPAPIPESDPAATVPQGMPLAPLNQYLKYRNSFHWDKDAYVAAGCTSGGGCDYTKARIRHFVHMPDTSIKGTAIESVKYPSENRIWYNYPGQSLSAYGGTFGKPIAIGRVLDDGTSQVSRYSYDTGGFFNLTQAIDPIGRTTNYTYANQIDLTSISQTTEFGVQQTIAQYVYNTRHRPVIYTDASGQITTYTYNNAGQLTSATNPLGEKTSYRYNASSRLIEVINANNATAAFYTYDSFERIRTFTDSEGWIATYDYDAADRLTKIAYPDGTSDQYAYDKLDLASYRDREGRQWTYRYDANRRLTSVTDPLGQRVLFGYSRIGNLSSLTDPKNNITRWSYDVEGRLSQKTYADNGTLTYTYENTTSRLRSTLDALGQSKQYSYTGDNQIAAISYLNAIHSTPNVVLAYDPYFLRLASTTSNGSTTSYDYYPVGSLGALNLKQEGGPLADSTIEYAYDALNRVATRTVQGAGAETFGYDVLGRLTSHASDLGSFTLGYLGQTAQITSRRLASSTLATSWNYLPNSGDRRLSQISNVGLSVGQYSTYDYVTTPENFVTKVTETSDVSPAYSSAGAQIAAYNNLNQLTSLSGQALIWDANGNLLSDGQRTYSWDAEDRLIEIAYPDQPGKATIFAYDALGRRTTITSAPAGGGASVVTSYIWCGSAICQARNAANAVTRQHYPEGEFVPGASAQTFYYGIDQIGSIRRVFKNASDAPAYSYDPYGVPLQAAAPLTEFGYAKMFSSPDNGLDLTLFRAYNPIVGQWLSRDPIGELINPAGNLYAYVGGNPVSFIDPLGLAGSVCPPAVQDLASRLEAAGGGAPRFQPTPKGAAQFLFPNGMKLRFDLYPGQYGDRPPNDGPHINFEAPWSPAHINVHIEVINPTAPR